PGRGMEQGGASGLDERGGIREISRRDEDSRIEISDYCTRISYERPDGDDDAARCRGLPGGRAGDAVRRALAYRNRSTLDQVRHEDGRAEVQDAGDGGERGVD